MTKTRYKIITKNSEVPVRDLIRISGDKEMTASLDPFAPDDLYSYCKGLRKPKNYSHPLTREKMIFREATTAESILIASCDFKGRSKPQIFDRQWLRAGLIVKTDEGIFTNPPRYKNGTPKYDNKTLKSYLDKVEPIKIGKGKVYIVPDSENLRDFGFAEYDSFKTGVQNCDTFVKGGLARVLEHTKDEAKNLRKITSIEFYEGGISVRNFNSYQSTHLVIGLLTKEIFSNYLEVYYDSDYYCNRGLVFGVLEKDIENVSKK